MVLWTFCEVRVILGYYKCTVLIKLILFFFRFPGMVAVSGVDCDLLVSIACSGASGIMVSALLLDDAHELHPGVVLRVAPHAPALPHGGGRSSALTHTRSSDDTGPHTTEAEAVRRCTPVAPTSVPHPLPTPHTLLHRTHALY